MVKTTINVRGREYIISHPFFCSVCLCRRPRQPLPFVPILKDPPVLACDHPEGLVDGYDRPLHLFDGVLNSSVLHKCASNFVAEVLGSSHRYCFRLALAALFYESRF